MELFFLLIMRSNLIDYDAAKDERKNSHMKYESKVTNFTTRYFLFAWVFQSLQKDRNADEVERMKTH